MPHCQHGDCVGPPREVILQGRHDRRYKRDLTYRGLVKAARLLGDTQVLPCTKCRDEVKALGVELVLEYQRLGREKRREQRSKQQEEHREAQTMYYH